jgi:hypothetical protein
VSEISGDKKGAEEVFEISSTRDVRQFWTRYWTDPIEIENEANSKFERDVAQV